MRQVFFLLLMLLFLSGLYAQPAILDETVRTSSSTKQYWSLDAGAAMSDILVRGQSFGLVFDPKFSFTPAITAGLRNGINYSFEDGGRNIFSLETQLYLRWNFLRLGAIDNPKGPVNIFAQAGLGLLASYRGNEDAPNNIFNDVTMTRGSLLAEAAIGVTVPLTERWHIEASLRGGYPHIAGVSFTAGYKFPLRREGAGGVFYRDLPPRTIVERIMITSVEYILFAGDIGRYNVALDHDAESLNELVLNSIAQFLKDNPNCIVRIEGHANPVTTDPREADELMMLSTMRSNAVAAQLRERGITDEQMVVVSFGGTRTVTSDHDIWNRNRRVELVLIQIDPNF